MDTREIFISPVQGSGPSSVPHYALKDNGLTLNISSHIGRGEDQQGAGTKKVQGRALGWDRLFFWLATLLVNRFEEVQDGSGM
eukprot:scaffold150419_cov59-Attheya_sp.AAC.4